LKLTDGVATYHISSGRCKITIQQFWGYERVEHQATIEEEQNGMSIGDFMAICLVERS